MATPPPHASPWLFLRALTGPSESLLRCLLDARRRYGDIYVVDTGMKRAIILNHPNHIRHILQKNRSNYIKQGTLRTPLKELTGQGIINKTGVQWREQRRTIQPSFQPQTVKAQAERITTVIESYLPAWERASVRGEKFDVASALMHMSIAVILHVLFRLPLSNPLQKEMADALLPFSASGIHSLLSGFLPPWLPWPGKSTQQRSRKRLDYAIQALLDWQDKEGEPGSLLATLADGPTSTGEKDWQTIRDEVITLIVAGYETTAAALTWALYLIAEHPRVQQRLQIEADTSPMLSAPYQAQVLQEVHRLYPPAWRLSRMAVNDDNIDGFHIPARSSVLALIYVVQRHPDFWYVPNQFMPERFATPTHDPKQDWKWVPFGAGQRQCVGRDFALLEMQAVLVCLLQRYTFSNAQSTLPIRFVTTLKPKGPVWLYVQRRE